MFTYIRRLARRIRFSQRGSAIATVVGAMAAMTTFGITVTAGVAVFSKQSTRDRSVKRALAASEAGVHEARYRMNMLQPTVSNPCVTISEGQYALAPSPGSGQWCGEETVALGSGNTSTYQLSPYSANGGVVTRKIVSTGTVNGVSRRVEATTSANTGAPLFSPFALASDEDLNMSGNADVNGNVRSNKNINMSGNARVCGAQISATPGPGHSVNLSGNAEVCGPTTPAETEFVLTPPDQGDAPTNNDNGRFFALDLKSGNNVNWNAANRQLSISSNSTLRLSGHTYSFCKLTLSGNSQLIIGAGAEVRIFIDSISNCGLTPPSTNQFSMSGNSQIINTDRDPTKLQIYMMGGTPNAPNSASLSGNAVATQMTFYAPYTNLSISGNGAAFTGAFVANQITISGNGSAVSYDSSVETITASTIGVFQPQKFVECTPTKTGDDPNSGC